MLFVSLYSNFIGKNKLLNKTGKTEVERRKNFREKKCSIRIKILQNLKREGKRKRGKKSKILSSKIKKRKNSLKLNAPFKQKPYFTLLNDLCIPELPINQIQPLAVEY